MDGDLTFGVAIKSTGDGSVVSDAKASQEALQNLDDSVKVHGATAKESAEYIMGMSTAESNAKDKAWAMANGYKEAGGVLSKASKDAAESVHGNSMAMRESLVLVREAARGNYTRMAGSASLLAQAFGVLPAIFSPVGIAIGAVAAAIGGMGFAAYEGSKELEDMNRVLAMTGDYSGQTSDSLYLLSHDISDTSQLTIGQSKDMATQLASSGKIGADAFNSVAVAVAAYAQASGESEAKVTPMMVKLFANPAKGAAELNSTMHFLTSAELDHIAALEREGEVTQAQLALADALNTKLQGRTQQLGWFASAWDAVAKAGSSAWNAMEGLGRPDTIDEKITKVQARITAWAGDEMHVADIKNLQNELTDLQAEKIKKAADAKATSAKAEQQDYDIQTLAIARQNSELWKKYLIEEQLARVTGGGSVDAPSNDAVMQDAAAALSKRTQAHDKQLADAKRFDDQMLESDKSSFAKRIDEWVKFENIIEAKIKSGDAGAIEEKKLHAAALDALTLGEYNKQTAINDAAAKKKEQQQAAAFNSEKKFFAEIQAAADAAGMSAGGKEKLRYDRELITLNAEHAKTAALVKNDHDKKLAEQEAYEIALANIKRTYALQSYQESAAVHEMALAYTKGTHAEEITSTLSYLTTLSAMGASHHRSMFELNKIASVASAIVHTYEGISGVLAEFPGPVGWGMAAAQAAIGFAQVDAIESTQFGGGAANSGGGGIPSLAPSPGVPVTPVSPQSATASAAPAPVTPTQQVNITLVGDRNSAISYDQMVNQVIPTLKQALGNGIDLNVQLTTA